MVNSIWLIWKDPDAGKHWGQEKKGMIRGWDGWMASPTQWTWVWVDSGNWCWTGRPGVLWFMGLQRVGHDWATELNWTKLMELAFQVPMQYCCLQHQTLLLSPVTSTSECCFSFGSVFILSGVVSPLISSSISGTYRPGEFIFQCPISLPFHTVHGALKARILKWFAIPFSSGPQSVRPLHHDLSILGGPTWHGLVSLS